MRVCPLLSQATLPLHLSPLPSPSLSPCRPTTPSLHHNCGHPLLPLLPPRGASFHFWDATDDITDACLDLLFETDRLYFHNATGRFGAVPMSLTGALCCRRVGALWPGRRRWWAGGAASACKARHGDMHHWRPCEKLTSAMI